MSSLLQVKKWFRNHVAAAVVLVIMADVLIAAVMVGGNYFYNYKLPHRLASSHEVTKAGRTKDWGKKFSNRFSDKIISTDTTYKSPNISIEVTEKTFDSGVVDHSRNDVHAKYGTKITYVLADIYVKNIKALQTGFAEDTYGVGFAQTLKTMSKNMKSLLSVNGDSYSNNRHKDNGTIIRNGIVYRTGLSTEETCVLYRNGRMAVYTPEEFDASKVIKDGAWQTWVFGPSLLDKKGKAKKDFLTWDYIRESHPRTAIGYYEPGHYCILVVQGRRLGYSRGMFLKEMSQLFEKLGCKTAYNLDGGNSSIMMKADTIISHPFNPNKTISDGIFICEPEV